MPVVYEGVIADTKSTTGGSRFTDTALAHAAAQLRRRGVLVYVNFDRMKPVGLTDTEHVVHEDGELRCRLVLGGPYAEAIVALPAVGAGVGGKIMGRSVAYERIDPLNNVEVAKVPESETIDAIEVTEVGLSIREPFVHPALKRVE